MLELVDLFVFDVKVAPELGVASCHGVGGFQQIVAKETVAGLIILVCSDSKSPDWCCDTHKIGILGNRCLSVKPEIVTDFGDDAGRVDFTDSRNGCKRIRDDFVLVSQWPCPVTLSEPPAHA